MPMLSIQHPQNATFFYSLIIDLVNFKFFDVDYILEKMLGIKNKVKGYGDNLIFSLGMLFLGLVLIVLFIVGLFFLHKVMKNNEKVQKIKSFFFKLLFFNFFIRMFIQSYLNMTLASMMNLFALNFENAANAASSSLAILLGLFLNCYPGLMFYLLYRFKDTLHLEKMKNRAGTMYAGLELDNGFAPLLYNVIFVFRRLIFVYIIIALKALPFLQI